MKKTFLLFTAVLSISLAANGQSAGPSYRQFFFNPYLFNPAYVAISGETEVGVVYRQQWINFKDAPVTTGLSLQHPASSRVSLGLNISSDKQVILKNSTFMATFGYVVPFSNNESLRFGLSAGTGVNTLDLTADELNTNDPAILNAAGNSYYLDGNFGVVYTRNRLRAGFALTKLFKSDPFSPTTFNNVALSNLRNQLYSVSYRFTAGFMENITIEPYIVYRISDYGLTSGDTKRSLEVASIAYFKNTFWTGLSYHQHNGMAIFLGMNVKEKFRFSYSFEFPPFTSEMPATSSHELHFSINLGKNNLKQGVQKQTERSIN